MGVEDGLSERNYPKDSNKSVAKMESQSCVMCMWIGYVSCTFSKNNSARLHLHRMTFYCISSVNGIDSVGSFLVCVLFLCFFIEAALVLLSMMCFRCGWCARVADTNTLGSYSFCLRRSRIMRFMAFVTTQCQWGAQCGRAVVRSRAGSALKVYFGCLLSLHISLARSLP